MLSSVFQNEVAHMMGKNGGWGGAEAEAQGLNNWLTRERSSVGRGCGWKGDIKHSEQFKRNKRGGSKFEETSGVEFIRPGEELYIGGQDEKQENLWQERGVCA